MNFCLTCAYKNAISVESQNPTEISQDTIARLSVCALDVKNSDRVQAMLVSHKHPAPSQVLGISVLSPQNALIHNGI